jgi:hypothetical protein
MQWRPGGSTLDLRAYHGLSMFGEVYGHLTSSRVYSKCIAWGVHFVFLHCQRIVILGVFTPRNTQLNGPCLCCGPAELGVPHGNRLCKSQNTKRRAMIIPAWWLIIFALSSQTEICLLLDSWTRPTSQSRFSGVINLWIFCYILHLDIQKLHFPLVWTEK